MFVMTVSGYNFLSGLFICISPWGAKHLFM